MLFANNMNMHAACKFEKEEKQTYATCFFFFFIIFYFCFFFFFFFFSFCNVDKTRDRGEGKPRA